MADKTAGGASPAIVIDLGKVRSKVVRDFKRGRGGKLALEVEQVGAEARQRLGEDAAKKELVPIVLVYRKKEKRRSSC
jgi:hypothetical protein